MLIDLTDAESEVVRAALAFRRHLFGHATPETAACLAIIDKLNAAVVGAAVEPPVPVPAEQSPPVGKTWGHVPTGNPW